MQTPYFLEIKAHKIPREQREILSKILLRVAQNFSFLGMQDWEIELGKKEMVLGIATEFHDLTIGRDLEAKFTLYFASRKDAGLYKKVLEKSFAELKIGAVKRQAAKDWMKEWRKHYKPLLITHEKQKLWIYPAWKKIPAAKKRGAVVRIHPGQAFGTGTHSTTSLCLELFLAHIPHLPRDQWRVLDFGAGTGILGFAAEKWAKLQGIPIRAQATEIDMVARKQFRKNARLNGSKISVREKCGAKKFDLIFANVLAPVLLQERDFLLDSLAPGGVLLLSGILWSEAKEFQKKFGLSKKQMQCYRKGDWAAYLVYNQ